MKTSLLICISNRNIMDGVAFTSQTLTFMSHDFAMEAKRKIEEQYRDSGLTVRITLLGGAQ